MAIIKADIAKTYIFFIRFTSIFLWTNCPLQNNVRPFAVRRSVAFRPIHNARFIADFNIYIHDRMIGVWDFADVIVGTFVVVSVPVLIVICTLRVCTKRDTISVDRPIQERHRQIGHAPDL